MGAGSVLGALATGARGTVGPGLLVTSAALFGLAELLAALAPSLETQALALVPLGAASVTFAAGVNSSLQIESAPALRGRVMALYAMVFLGSTAIGAPLTGLLAQAAGPRAGLYAGAVAALAAGAWAHTAFGERLPGRACGPSRPIRARREAGTASTTRDDWQARPRAGHPRAGRRRARRGGGAGGRAGDAAPGAVGRGGRAGRLGEEAVLLFWNAGCGHCRAMEDDLRALDGGPRLLLIAPGGEEPGIPFPLLRDPERALARAFGASGTPMAVQLDAAGRPASGVARGADAVLGLLRPRRVLDVIGGRR